jgi:chromosome partitioning protein
VAIVDAPSADTEDNWTVESVETDQATTSAPITEAPPEPEPEIVPAPAAAPAAETPAPTAAAVTGAAVDDEITLAPAEGGHVEPPRPGPERVRSGHVGLPGSAERGRSVDEAESDGGDSDDDEPLTYDLPRIIAIANQKGGVGKTTTSVNLGASLAELGYRVLVVDLDPQGNATTGLGINARNLQASVYDVIMTNSAIEDCVEPTSLKNLFVAPATIDLAGAEIELVPAFSRELKLRRALEEVREDYDYVLIDCPPSLGLLTVNGLAAADDVIVPIQCEYYALEGLSQLIRNVTLVRTNLNPKLDVRGIVLTMYDARTKLADQVEQEVREHFGRRVYQTVVPRTVRLSEAPSFGQPIIVFDSTSRGAVAYRELAKEVSSGATRRAG